MANDPPEVSMGYPKHLLLAFGGPMGGTESWSCSLRMTSSTLSVAPDALLDSVAEAGAEQVRDKVEQYIRDLGGRWHKAARLGFVKLNGINADGHYVGQQTHEWVDTAGLGFDTTSSTGPFQLSMAVSLATANKRGLAARGRFYLPAPPLVVSDQGFIGQENCLAYATLTATFIDNLNNWEGLDPTGAPDVCVVSRGKVTGPKQWGPGTFSRVEQVRVGNVMDTQQSRRRSLKEQYYWANTTGAGA